MLSEKFQKIKSRCVERDGCWEWSGCLNNRGYGRLIWQKREWLAHRLMFCLSNGDLTAADGAAICHRCDNRKCLNPDHLFVGTWAENIHDMFQKGRNRHPKGEDAGRAILSNDDVLAIRRRYDAGEKQSVIARDFPQVCDQTVRLVARRKSWRHIQ